MSTWRELSQKLLEREFTRREFILYLLALIPILIGINGLLKKFLEAGNKIHPELKGYGSRLYGK